MLSTLYTGSRFAAVVGRCRSWPFRYRSEERRVGEEGRSRWAPYPLKKKKPKRAPPVFGQECLIRRRACQPRGGASLTPHLPLEPSRWRAGVCPLGLLFVRGQDD